MIKWYVTFYRPNETSLYASCFVWKRTAKDAIDWAWDYFKPIPDTRIEAEKAEEAQR